MITVIISYLAYLVIVAGLGIAGIYHAREFGFPGDKTRVAAGVYVLVVVAIVAFTFVTFGGIQITGNG
jgi:hypothetical protein